MTRPEPDPLTTGRPPESMHDVSAPKANDPERIYYEGSPLVRGTVGTMLIFFILGLVLLAVPFLWRWLQNAWPYWVITAVCIVLGLALFVMPMIYARSIRYRISNYRIDFERGLLGKQIDTMELWHVDDIKFQQSLTQRLLGVGTITIYSDDQTTPSLPLRGLPRPREIFDALKARVIAIKRSRGVIKMDT